MNYTTYYSSNSVFVTSDDLGEPKVGPFLTYYDLNRKINYFRIVSAGFGISIKKNYIEIEENDSCCCNINKIKSICGTIYCNRAIRIYKDEELIDEKIQPLQVTTPNEIYDSKGDIYYILSFIDTIDISEKYPEGLGGLTMTISIEDIKDVCGNNIDSENGIYAVYARSFCLNLNDITQNTISNLNEDWIIHTYYGAKEYNNLKEPFIEIPIKLANNPTQFVEIASGNFKFYINISPSKGYIECSDDIECIDFNSMSTNVHYEILKNDNIIVQASFERNQLLPICFDDSNNIPVTVPLFQILNVVNLVKPNDDIILRVYLDKIIDVDGNDILNRNIDIECHINYGFAFNEIQE